MVKRAITPFRQPSSHARLAHTRDPLVGRQMRYPLTGGAGSLSASKVGSFLASAEAKILTTLRSPVVCISCESKIITHTQIGHKDTHKHSFPCPTCGDGSTLVKKMSGWSRSWRCVSSPGGRPKKLRRREASRFTWFGPHEAPDTSRPASLSPTTRIRAAGPSQSSFTNAGGAGRRLPRACRSPSAPTFQARAPQPERSSRRCQPRTESSHRYYRCQ